MTFQLLLPIALSVTAPQDQAQVLPTPPMPNAAPVQAAPPVPPMAPTEPASPPQAPAAPADMAEFADPLSDPSTLPHAAQLQAGVHHHAPGDPLEGFNRAMFGVNQALDKAVIRPAAMGYKHILPRQVRSGLRNFFVNLTEPVVFMNYLLQLRIGKAARTLGRFTINSTVGVGGLIDVAKTRAIKLPHHRNSFGDTLAWYGVKPGPYVFLPLVGPSTLRDLLGGPIDGALVPALVALKVVGQPVDSVPFLVADVVIPGLDLRAESDADLRALLDGAVDPYATLRSAWLQERAAEVAAEHHHNRKPQPAPELDDPLRDPSPAAPRPAVAPPAPAVAPVADGNPQ